MKKLKLGNLEVILPEPYRQGHVCTAKEASLLNALYHKRLKDNLQSMYAGKYPIGEGNQLAINQYIRSYSLNGPSQTDVEAYTLALQVVKQTIKANGGLLKEWRDCDLRKQAKNVLESKIGLTIRRMAITRAEDLAEAVKARLEEAE